MAERGGCQACADSIDLDETALVLVDGAEVAVIACDTHLRRVALAIELLECQEAVLTDVMRAPAGMWVPPLVDVAFEARLAAAPNRRLP